MLIGNMSTVSEATKTLLELEFRPPHGTHLAVIVDRPTGSWRARLVDMWAAGPQELAVGVGRMMDQALRACLAKARTREDYVPKPRPKRTYSVENG